eukprot:COSAG06_NODE_663_length_13295_cov_33.836945_2_plen_44_part_00
MGSRTAAKQLRYAWGGGSAGRELCNSDAPPLPAFSVSPLLKTL